MTRLTALLSPLRRIPVPYATIALAVMVTTTSILSWNLGPFTAESEFDLREIGLSLLTVDEPLPLVAFVVLLLGAGGAAERVFGARRLLLVYLVGGVATSVVGLLIGAAESTFLLGVPLSTPPFSGAPPIAALLGVVMAASCFAGALWRRRVRLAGTFVAITLFLYSASASDLYSLIALPIGLAAGYLAGGTRVALRVQRSSHHETRVLLATVTAVTAVGPMIATLWGSGAGLLSVYGWLSSDPLIVAGGRICAVGSEVVLCPDDVSSFSELHPASGWVASLPLLILLVAAWGILRGRRAALTIAVGVNVLVFAGMLYVFAVTTPETLDALATLRSADVASYAAQALVGTIVGALVPLVVALVLVAFRRAAPVASAPGARAAFVSTVLAGFAASLLSSLVGTFVLAADFTPEPSADVILRALPLRLLPPSLLPGESVAFVPTTGWAQAVWYLPSVLFWVVCVVASVRLIVSSRAVGGAQDRARAHELLERTGGGSLAYMTTWPGNAYWFSPDGRAAVAYRVQGSIAVTLGAPFGSDRCAPDVVKGFIDHCGEHAWTPVFYSVDEQERAALDVLGWRQTQVAEEAWMDPSTWTPAGKKRQDVRTATNRAAREGVRAEWTSWHDLSFFERNQIRGISEAWIADKTIPEMGFTLGGVDQISDRSVRLMLARDADGHIVAVTSWIPLFDDGHVVGYTLDFMRRRHDAMNGVMEFVIGAVVERLREEGLRLMSLSGSPLAYERKGDEANRDSVERALDLLSTLMEPAYGFRSLASFKKKFQPEFAPLWMVYPDPAQLPAIGVALMRCYVPGLTLPRAARIASGLRAKARSSAGR